MRKMRDEKGRFIKGHIGWNKGKPITWTNDKLKFLKKNYAVLCTTDLAKKLGKTVTAIHQKASDLELKKRKYIFAHAGNRCWVGGITEEQLLEDYEGGLSTTEIGKKCGVYFTAVAYWLRKLGAIRTKGYWTPHLRRVLSERIRGKKSTLEARNKISASLRKLDANDLIRIIHLCDSGYSFRDILRTLKLPVDPNTISQYYHKFERGKYAIEDGRIVVKK